jgi:hypothetical protein
VYKRIFTYFHASSFKKKLPQRNNQPMLKTRHRVRYLALLLLLIHANNLVRNRSYLHRCALLAPAESPWTKLYHHGGAPSFLMMTGMSRQAFLQLFDILFIDGHQQHYRGGRPPLMDPIAQLGLYLFFVGSTMGIKHLCLIFGVIPSVCSCTITAMLSLVVQKLKRHPWARVKFPDVDQMASFARQIKSREPEVDDVIGFMDGLLLTSECTSEMLEQNSMYNGYHSNTMVNNLIAYGPDSKVFLCAVNFPGSWHDGSITANILPYIRERIGSYKMCVDSGLTQSHNIIKS